MNRKRKASGSKNTTQTTAKRTRLQKKQDENTSEADNDHDSSAIDPPVTGNGRNTKGKRARQTKKQDEDISKADDDHDSSAVNPPAVDNGRKAKGKRARQTKKQVEEISEADNDRNSSAINPPATGNGRNTKGKRARQTKKQVEDINEADNDHESSAVDPPAVDNGQKATGKKAGRTKKPDKNTSEAESDHALGLQVPESGPKSIGPSEISNRRRLRSGRKVAYVDVPNRKSGAKVQNTPQTENSIIESISTPRPRALVRPRPWASPDPWGGFNIAWNKARPARQEQRTSAFLQNLHEGISAAPSPMSSPSTPVLESRPSTLAPVPLPSVSASTLASPPASEPLAPVPAFLPSAHEEGDEGDDEDEIRSISRGPSQHRATTTEIFHTRFDPGSPSFVENIRCAMDLSKSQEISALRRNREPHASHEGSPDHTATADDPPKGPCWTPPPPHSSSPPLPQFCYKFHRYWSVYWGEGLEEGRQTAVDRVTTWRMFDETEWKPVPVGYVVPRISAEHEHDGIVAEYQNVAFAAANQGRHELNEQYAKEELARSKEESRLAALAEAAREEVEFAAAAKEEAAKKLELTKEARKEEAAGKKEAAGQKEAAAKEAAKKQLELEKTPVQTRNTVVLSNGRSVRTAATAFKLKAPKARQEEDYQSPSESDLSGSDFSTTRKSLTKKRHLSSSSEDSSSEDSGENSPIPRRRPTKLPKLQLVPSTPVMTSRSAVARSSHSVPAKDGHLTPAQPGRPSTEQMKFVENIRSTFYNSVKEGARLFNTKEETIIKQTGLGGMAKPQKMKLFNLYQAVIKKEPMENSSPGTWSQNARIEYESKTKGLSDEDREKFRLELMSQLGKMVDEEVKGVSPVMRMNRIEKDLMQMITNISQDHPDLHLFVIKVYSGDDPAAKAKNGVLTGTQRGHETLQDLPLDLATCINFLYDDIRGKSHADKLKRLIDLKTPAVKPPADTDKPNAEECTSPPCTFIPLLEARKRRNMSKAKPGDLQAFVPLYTESVEELWRGRRVTMSSVMKDLEARQSTEQNHVPTTRKNVSTCLKIALNSFRPPSDPAKQFPYNHFVNQATLYQIKLTGWPVAVGTAPGCGFNAQLNQRAIWDSLAGALRNGVLVMEKWSEDKKKLTPGTAAYFEIPLVVSTQGLTMAMVKDCKAAARSLQPKANSHDQPQVEADIFDKRDETSGNDGDSHHGNNDIQRDSKTRSFVQNSEHSEHCARNPYKVVQTARNTGNVVMDTDLDGLTAFDESDLPEIALVDDATSYPARNVPRHDQHHLDDNWRYLPRREESAIQYTRANRDLNANIQQGSERRMNTHEHYKVPHRGDLGGHQYRQLVVDIPKKTNQLPTTMQSIPLPARSTGEYALPVSKAHIGAPSSRSHTSLGSVQSSNFYARLHSQPSTRILPPTHPANRIPPPGQRFVKGKEKEKARVHAAQSNFPLRVRQEQDEQVCHQPQEYNQAHRFVNQRLPQDGQAGPSREVFLTREEELRRRHAFVEDAYVHAVYEEEEEN